ncbi:MAG TPA: hypothetical protein P5137_16870, partial [Candidatus Brocadiia bacterium]|nr:hypothetical protein [Candidatus Brocadiia bacterium]
MNIIHPVDGTPQEAAYPCLAQPKYDGVRAIWRDGCLQTVNGRPMPALSSLASAILSSRAPSAPADMILDGEIIGDAWADAVAAVSSASPLHGLRYVIWDALTTREALGLCPMPGYAARLARLRDWLSIPQQSSAVSICPGVLCASPSEAA